MKLGLNVLCVVVLILLSVLPMQAQNLLVNPSFEAAPYGDFPYDGVYSPTGWTPGSSQYLTCYTGVFDSAWKNHNCNYPTWPDPVHQPVDGGHFLAKWLPPHDETQTSCDYDNNADSPSYGHLRQTITGLDAGATYYFSAWFANNNPHGWQTDRGWQYPMFRVGVLQQTYDPNTGALTPEYKADDPTDTLGVVFVPLQEVNPESWSNYLKKLAGSDEAWSKLSGKVTMDPGKNAITYFIEFFVDRTDLGYSEEQYVQVDNCRLATSNSLEIANLQVTAISDNSATIEWDVTDGDAKVTGLSGTPCFLEYGPTTSYGSTAPAAEPNSTPCINGSPGQPGHYKAVLNNLTAGQTYHYRVVVNPGSYSRVDRYNCSNGVPINIETWSYDGNQSQDAVFVPNPKVVITVNPKATGITKDSATITWTTDVDADSRVDYGKLGVYEDVKTDAALTKSHSVTLTGLWPNTNTYAYKVTSSAPGRSPATSAKYTFKTALGPDIMNGDFEFRPVTAAKAPYWTDAPMYGGLQLFHTPEWGVHSHGGNWYLGAITNFGGAQDKIGVYQQITTTPGDIISVYVWSYADGCADCFGVPAGEPHRFGEVNNQIGLDPSGNTMTMLSNWLGTTAWGAQLSSIDWHTYPSNLCKMTGIWRRLGICAVAGADKATIYLRTRSWYGNGWLYNVFDDVKLEPPTQIHSVGELKALPIQTNVNLTQGDYVVTYVERYGVTDENDGQPYFYIQDRKAGGAGIKVTAGLGYSILDTIELGQKLNIIGTMDWGIFTNLRVGNQEQQLRLDKPAGELVLRAVKIDNAGPVASLPEPVAVTNFSLGGGSSADPFFTNAGVAGGAGANNVGTRVRTWGKIVEIGLNQDNYIYMVVDDGSRLPLPPAAPYIVNDVKINATTLASGHMSKTSKIADYQHEPGLFVQTWLTDWPTNTDGSQVAVGDYVILTGISGVRLDLDTDDHQCIIAGTLDPENPDPELIPEAEKNMRFIKLDEENGAQFFNLQ